MREPSGAGVAGPRRRRQRLERNTRDVGELAKPGVARAVLDGLGLTKDGRLAAPSTVQRQRGVLVDLAEYAVERRLLAENPITVLPRKAPKVAQAVDRRVVVNPEQARALLDAVAVQKPSGDRLVAFFGAMYYAALRPAEALMLCKVNLALPVNGWGELLLESSLPVAGPAWTDSGRRRRNGRSSTAPVVRPGLSPARPRRRRCCMRTWKRSATAPDGLLFRGIRSGEMSERTYCRVWRKARVAALTADEVRSPWRAGPTTFGTRPCRQGSTPVCPPPRSPRGPGMASPSCSRSTPSASSARRTPRAAGSMPCWAGREASTRIRRRRPG